MRTQPNSIDHGDVAYAGMARQAELLRARQIWSPELVRICLERIERIDPELNCFRVVMAARALDEAAAAQARLDAGDDGPLFGVPVAVKDQVDVAGELTTYGTGGVVHPARRDAEVIHRLPRAGAVIIGKTNVPELKLLGNATESKTWGITRNPWDPARSPGGSSGGSAAAVAAGLAGAALGADGGASIRVPAAMCGLFGLKPQRCRISPAPYSEVDYWYGLTQLGPLTRGVLDGALFCESVMGPAPGDARPPPPSRSLVEAARTHLGRLRIALSTRPSVPVRLGPRARAAVEDTASLLRSLGHEVARADPDYPRNPSLVLPRIACGAYDDAARLDEPERLERRTKAMVGLGRVLHGRMLTRSLAAERRIAARINALFETYDVLLTPLTAAPPPRADRWRGKGLVHTFLGMMPYIAYTAAWNSTGQPAVSVPAGFDDYGLPLAVQFVRRPNDEATLISLAAQIEAARPWCQRRPPLGCSGRCGHVTRVPGSGADSPPTVLALLKFEKTRGVRR